MTTHQQPRAEDPTTHRAAVEKRSRLGRRAQLLAGASVTYNVVETVIAISAGLASGSVALVGFGLDSIVEVCSGLIIVWQFRHSLPESREQTALRLMALSFFALAAYVGFESTRALVTGAGPDSSTTGIALAVASLVVMPMLSWAQRRTGRALGSSTVVADSTQTLLCTYMSAALLCGLIVNATLGWSWADPSAGLVIAALAVKEGRDAWRGQGCCGSIRSHVDHGADHGARHCDCAGDSCQCNQSCGAVEPDGRTLVDLAEAADARHTQLVATSDPVVAVIRTRCRCDHGDDDCWCDADPATSTRR